MMDSSSIGERIKLRRKQLGLSQADLAIKLGYKSRSSLNKIEKDSRNLTQSKIKAIADVLETTPSWIMGWDDEPEKAATTEETKIDSRLQKVIDCYNGMNVEGQNRLIEQAELLKSSGKYDRYSNVQTKMNA